MIDRFDDIEAVAGRRIYGIINKTTDVVEAVGPQLSSAISSLYNMQAELDAAREYVNEIKSGNADTQVNVFGDIPKH